MLSLIKATQDTYLFSHSAEIDAVWLEYSISPYIFQFSFIPIPAKPLMARILVPQKPTKSLEPFFQKTKEVS